MKPAALVWIGVLVSACSARPIDEEAGVTTVASGSETDAEDSSTSGGSTSATAETTTESTETESTESTTETTTGDGDGDGDDWGDDCTSPDKLDLPPDFDDVPMPDSCTIEWIEWPTPDQYPNCTICQFETPGCFNGAYLACVTPAAGQTCEELCPSGDCLATYWNTCEGEGPGDDQPLDTCGHYEIDGQCCTIGSFFAGCAE